MRVTGGNVDDGIDDDDDEKRNTVSFLVLPGLHSAFVANLFHILTHVSNGDCAHFLSPSLCWTEYYIEHGCDVYLFNYAGYGRSFGGSSWNQTTTEFSHGFLGTLKRVLFSTFLAFKPSSESLKLDAAIVARHIVDDVIGGR